ncbi:hypothetical protein [Ktedonospora formicarum]|uniref:Uncharacterized protein n=1 Tax=Ktedonospora formicarum TaxID=2778364 RepID=A0A8J3MS70_9CHLR|nr:hypothetical protein [Ktedonospora formicarum]GHO44546.1 hypothetical protein KSX_27090 [Ktedonospora formicarum]
MLSLNVVRELTPKAQALMNVLLINALVDGVTEREYKVDELVGLCGFNARSSIYRAKEELVKAGVIEVEDKVIKLLGLPTREEQAPQQEASTQTAYSSPASREVEALELKPPSKSYLKQLQAAELAMKKWEKSNGR